MFFLIRVWEWAAVLMLGTAVARLGDEVWAVRDAAEQQLRDAGIVACPAIAAGLTNPSPEVNARCRRLLALPIERLAQLRAAAVLFGFVEPDYEDLLSDFSQQKRIQRLAAEVGCSSLSCRWFDCELEWFWFNEPAWHAIERGVASCRRELHGQSPIANPYDMEEP